ncbi:MAG: transporter permease [Actinomycetia bacterium]|nr:transporter permease [Actinomycetes bacterium]
MLAFVVRRLLSGVLLIVLLTFVTFFVANEIPQNKACIVMHCTQQTTRAEMVAALHKAGLDRPVLVQYGDYLWRIVRHQSFGPGWAVLSPDSEIRSALPATASLVLGGMLLTMLLAVPLGAIAALRPRSPVDHSLLTFSVVGLAVHPFVLGILLQQFAMHAFGAPRSLYCPLTTHAVPATPTFPGQPIPLNVKGPDACGGPLQWAAHMAVPWLVFALFFVPLYLRMIRTRLMDTLGERYVMTARAKGAGERRVVLRHALRNGVGPLLPMVALDAGTAITAAIYVETIFALPGLGHLAVVGLSGEFFDGVYDLPLITSLVFTIGVFVVLLSAAADIASAWLDPRVRERTARGLIPLPGFLRRSVARA